MALDWAAVEAAGLLDDAEDPHDRRALLEFLASEGLTIDEMGAAHDRGALLRVAAEQRVLPGARTYTLAEVAGRVDADVERVRRAWRALGLVDPGPDVPVASDDDVDLARIALRQLDLFGEEVGGALLRRFGAVLERTTEAVSAAAIGAAPDISTLNSGSEAVTARAFTELAGIVPDVGRLLDLALRHHVEAVRRLFESSGAGIGGRAWLELGVGFADLSGFTSTTLTLDLDELGRMTVAFEARAAEVVARHGGRVVKFVGDAALFVCADPQALADMATALVQPEDGAAGLPARAGLTFGTVLARDGDYFGPAVNLAARLVDVAARHEVVVDDGLRAALDPARWTVDPLPAQELRGLPDPVVPYRLRRA